MIPVRIVSNAPLNIAGRVGETDELNQYYVTVWIDGFPYVVDQRYVKRVPWLIRVAASIMHQGETNE